MPGRYSVGIDLHKRTFDFVTLSSDGTVVSQGHRSSEEGSVQDFASTLDDTHSVIVEPVANAHWFLDQLRPHVGSVHMAHSTKVRLIAQSRTKSDRTDARILADLHRVGYLPEAYIPSPDLLNLRYMVQYRHRLIRDRTRLKNRAQRVLTMMGLQLPCKSAFSKRNREFMETVDLPQALRYQMDDLLCDMDYHTARIEKMEARLRRVGDLYPDLDLLCTIPGVGLITGISLIAIIGDIHRFRSAKAFARYTGLTPGHRDSGDTQHSTGITHEGNSTLRWLLVQSTVHLRRSCRHAHDQFNRIKYRSCVQEAKVAVAHRLARVIYHVWSKQRPYYSIA